MPASLDPDLPLTDHDRAVLRRLAVFAGGGLQAAALFRLSPRTVSEFVGNLLKKTGRPNRSALATHAVRGGLVEYVSPENPVIWRD